MRGKTAIVRTSRVRGAIVATALLIAVLASASAASAEYPTPGAPALTAGANPNNSGLFTLAWSGADPMLNFGLTYTLQHHDAASETWSTVATGIEALSYQFTGAGEAEGTWVYRVQGVDSEHEESTEYSPASAPVVVDKTPPNPPSASADRAPDFAEGGGWYKDSVTVSFSANGDPPLSDGSPGSGVEPASLSAPQAFSTSGAHTASGTVADNAGNVSAPGTLVVHVDATPPSLEVTCPASASVGEHASATVRASDGESGLASDPSGSVPINTEHAGSVTVTRTATDNVGHETTRSCTTKVNESPPEYGRCAKIKSHGFFTTAACATKQSTQTSNYEWISGVLSRRFTGAVASSALFETASKAKLSCTGGSARGTITSGTTVGSVVMTFTGCGTVTNKCTTAGRAEGELETRTLEGALGVYRVTVKEGKETRYVGLSLFPVGKTGTFIEFACGASSATVLKGAVIAQMTAGKMAALTTAKYGETSGKQKPEGFLGHEREVLTKVSNGEQVGLSMGLSVKYEEPLEINAFF